MEFGNNFYQTEDWGDTKLYSDEVRFLRRRLGLRDYFETIFVKPKNWNFMIASELDVLGYYRFVNSPNKSNYFPRLSLIHNLNDHLFF